MTDTASRLAAYKAAELRILQAQESRMGDRSRRNTELSEVRAAIKELEVQLASEISASNGPIAIFADFSRSLG